MSDALSTAFQAVVTVGDDGGRGFVIELDQDRFYNRYIITAAHCLPELPDPHPWAEKTFLNLVGPLGAEPTIPANCEFVDVVRDLAVLGMPDNQEIEEADKFEDLLDRAATLRIGGLHHVRDDEIEAESDALLLALDGRWFPCKVWSKGYGLWIRDAAESIRGGMSGSPILTPEGTAIGVVSVSRGEFGEMEAHREGGPQPELSVHLPGWILAGAGLITFN